MSFGTEQLEEELNLLLPDTEIARLDLDTTRGRYSYDRLIQHFGSGKTKILVGTQMVAKGLDFDNVGLVGIIDLDRMLHFPNFRSIERTFQLAVQVSGRAGRKAKQGKVLIQTYNPEQAIVHTIISQDYSAFYDIEVEDRRVFNYPPFSRIIKLTVKDRDHQTAAEAATQLYQLLITTLGQPMVLGPVTPAISKIRDKYLRELYLKIGRNKNMDSIKKIVQKSCNDIHTRKEFKTSAIVIDVDPS
jgi:primosomal protein N' (replication factor Y)